MWLASRALCYDLPDGYCEAERAIRADESVVGEAPESEGIVY
jgi:hypothetical protein